MATGPKAAKIAATKPTVTERAKPAPVDPLASAAAKLEAEKARQHAGHLATYRAAVQVLAAGRPLAPEEEQPTAEALAFLGLDTDALKRDVGTLQRVKSLRRQVGATVEEYVGKDQEFARKEREAIAALEAEQERAKKAIRLASGHRDEAIKERMNFGQSFRLLQDTLGANPRLFAATWPATPGAAPPAAPADPVPMPPAPPPIPTEIWHPLEGRMVPVTPERYAELTDPEQNNSKQHPGESREEFEARIERAQVDLKRRREAYRNQADAERAAAAATTPSAE
jgi:hypothetical protein